MSVRKELYQRWRERYKPERVKCLLIAEAPPKSVEGRFFYNPACEKRDFLFRAVMSVMREVFPDFTIDCRRGRKHECLQEFKERGFYLIDAVDIPINDMGRKERERIIRENLEEKLKEIEGLGILKSGVIILIKRSIFEVFYQELKRRGFRIAQDGYIPFPSSGRQREFREKFKRCLKKVQAELENC